MGVAGESCSHEPLAPPGTDPGLPQLSPELPVSDSISFRSGQSDVHVSHVGEEIGDQTDWAHEMPVNATCAEAMPKSTMEGGIANHQSVVQDRAGHPVVAPTEAGQVDVSLEVPLPVAPAHSPPRITTLKPVTTVTQAYARLGITAKDTQAWDQASWWAEWKNCGPANAQDTGRWRIHAIHFIIQHRFALTAI